jgi:hypothetical protein
VFFFGDPLRPPTPPLLHERQRERERERERERAREKERFCYGPDTHRTVRITVKGVA